MHILPKRLIYLLPHLVYWIVSCMTRAWEKACRASDRTVGEGILLTASWTPSRSPPTSYYVHLPYRSPQLANSPQCSSLLTPTQTHIRGGGESELYQMTCTCSERQPESVGQKETTAWALFPPLGKQKRGCQHLAKCVAGSGEIIQA